MCFSNMYFGLQTGWVTMGSIQSAILGFGVFKLLQKYVHNFGPFENVVLQTVAVATATMPLAGGNESCAWVTPGAFLAVVCWRVNGSVLLRTPLKLFLELLWRILSLSPPLSTSLAGFVGIIPALGLLNPQENPPSGALTLNWWELLLWTLALAFFGVFFAVPLRRQTILKEKLKFPSGTATAQMIRVLHRQPDPEASEAEIEVRLVVVSFVADSLSLYVP
jgi:uncharacterized oligopeptide transporter (OPT) family protein